MKLIYLLRCMWQKCARRGRSSILIFLGLAIAALGILTVASAARNRELQSPWYFQRAARIRFASPVPAGEAYDVLAREYRAGTINGYALIANADTTGGISLGGQEGNLWSAVTGDDAVYSTADNVFWIHQQAIPERYIHNLSALTANINGAELTCAGLAYQGLNWSNWRGDGAGVAFTLGGERPGIRSPFIERAYINNSWMYIAPVIVGAEWLARNNIPIEGACITLKTPNDVDTLNKISSHLNARHAVETDWDTRKMGALTANEWLYLGALILALLNVASLLHGLIDGYQYELLTLRKVGASKVSIYLAFAAMIVMLSGAAFIAAIGGFEIMLYAQGANQWLARLGAGYTLALLLGFMGVCLITSILHARRMLAGFRRIAANL